MTRTRVLAWDARVSGSLGTTVLPFALVLYLALRGGGYDTVVRSEVGIAIWWIVLLGAIVGLLPASRRLGLGAWIGLGLFAALAIWTAIGATWSESAERSVLEGARVATYLGVLALAVLAQGRDGLRRTVASIAAAIGVVGALALLSRLHPDWFPANETARFLPSTANRLNYPLNYWNGLATLMMMGVPLMIGVVGTARAVLARSLAMAAIPVLALTAYYTLSRGGLLEMAVAIGVLVALWPRRLQLLPSLLVAAVGSGLLILAASQRDLLEDASLNAAAASQGDEMIAVTLVICTGSALLGAALTFAERARLLPSLSVPPRAAAVAAVFASTVAVAVFLALGGLGSVSDRWEEFKTSDVTATSAERFESASGNGRWEWWKASVDANESSPLTGIGPGTFEYWWARNSTAPGFVRDAHSLYLETFTELGIIGLALLIACLGWPLVAGIRRLRGATLEARMLLAAAIASMAAFLLAAAIDWVWELAVLPVVFILLAAALVTSSRDTADLESRSGAPFRSKLPSPSPPLAPRIAIGAVAVVALLGIGIPLASTDSIRASQAAASEDSPAELDGALVDAREAADLQPYAATPLLQQALILELQGKLGPAAEVAELATDKESTNWRTWLTLARIEAEAGDPDAALEAYRKAQSLNPRSPLFAS